MATQALGNALKTNMSKQPSMTAGETYMQSVEPTLKELKGAEEEKMKAEKEKAIFTGESESRRQQALSKATEAEATAMREDPARAQYEGLIQEKSKAEFIPTQENAKDMAALFSLMNVIGFAIGAGGKQHAQQAMSAMNGMLEGHQKGRDDLYRQQRNIFETNQKQLDKKIEDLFKFMQENTKLYAKDKVAAEQNANAKFAEEGAGFLKTYYEKYGPGPALEYMKQIVKAKEHAADLTDREKTRAQQQAARLQQAREVAAIKAGLGTAPAGPSVSNDIESSAQAIANYAQKPPGLRDKTRPQIMARVRQINPSYNEMDYGQRDLAMRNYTNPNGAGAKQLQAFTTVAGHLDSLERLGEALNNKDTQLANKVLNYISVQTGNPEVTNFNTAKQAVSGEVVKAITGTAGALADRKEAENAFNAIGSPEQLQGAIDTVKELIYSRLDTTRAQYESATGRHDFETRLPDIVKQTFIEKKRPASSPSPQTARKTQAPPEAVQYLKQHPEFKEQFKTKYGYLPEGM